MIAEPASARTTEPPVPETRTARLPDGRVIAYVESGDPRGAPVFAMHGLPGSRLQRYPDESVERAAGLRVIHADRPGFGVSSPQRHRVLADWPRDVAALADSLGLARFAIAGVSGGGPYAAACAALLGGRITSAAIVSSVGPPGTMHGRMTIGARLGFLLAPRASWVMKGPVATIAHLAVQSPFRYIDLLALHLAPADRPILARADVRAVLAQDMREAFRQGTAAFVQDLALVARSWDIPWRRIACSVRLWHGEDDWLIPPSATRHLVQMIPNARSEMLPREGHFLVFDRWPEICAWLAR